MSAHRRSLLPNVLREWAENELPEYAVFADSRESALEQTKRLAKVGSSAMAVLEPDDLTLIALEMGRTDESGPMRDRLEHFTEKLMEQSRSLPYLIARVASLQKRMKSGPGRPRNIIAYLVLRDTAAIYEWVTGDKARREVDRASGTEIGAFINLRPKAVGAQPALDARGSPCDCHSRAGDELQHVLATLSPPQD